MSSRHLLPLAVGRAAAVLATAAGFCTAMPTSAGAATTLGQLDPGPPSSNCSGTTYFAQASSSGPSYSVPAGGGVITSWSHKANSLVGRDLGLRAFRPVSGTTYLLVGGSGVQVLTPDAVNTFNTRIPVKAGDVLGVYVGNPGTGGIDFGGGASCAYTGTGTVNYRLGISPEPAPGASVDLVGMLSNYLLNVTARVEPDADADGFGDETQDSCPTSAATQGACPPPPDTAAPRGSIRTRSDSIKDGAVNLTLTSSEAATVTGSGTITLPGAARVYRLGGRTRTAKANVRLRLKLRIPKKARKPIYSFLRRGRKLTASVKIVLRDRAGNTSRTKRRVKLHL